MGSLHISRCEIKQIQLSSMRSSSYWNQRISHCPATATKDSCRSERLHSKGLLSTNPPPVTPHLHHNIYTFTPSVQKYSRFLCRQRSQECTGVVCRKQYLHLDLVRVPQLICMCVTWGQIVLHRTAQNRGPGAQVNYVMNHKWTCRRGQCVSDLVENIMLTVFHYTAAFLQHVAAAGRNPEFTVSILLLGWQVDLCQGCLSSIWPAEACSFWRSICCVSSEQQAISESGFICTCWAPSSKLASLVAGCLRCKIR